MAKENKKVKCPECGSELEKVKVEIEGAENKVLSRQCSKCGYFDFEPKSSMKVIEELKARESPLVMQQRIIKLSQGRLGMYFNRDLVRSLHLEPGKDILISVPDKKKIVLSLKE